MPYIREECIAGRTIEVTKYYSYHWGTPLIRGKYKKPTSEAQKRANLKQRSKELRRLINANFEDGEDCLLTMTFREEERPEDFKGLLTIAQKFFRRLRTEYKKAGTELKYVYVLEKGSRGALHIHAVVSWNNLPVFWKAWSWGYIDVKPLNSDGQYAKIADYFLKYAQKTEETEGQKLGKAWYGSRNLVHPVPKKILVKASSFREEPRAKKGYYVDKDSVYSGVSEITSMPFCGYTLVKLRC